MKRLLLLLLLLPALAEAQTFSVSPQTGPRPLVVTATWNVPGATICMPTGAWAGTGTKAASGSQQVTLNANAALGITCQVSTPAGPGTAVLSWTAPTQNTDGSPLTNLAGFNIYSGAVNPPATKTVISNPATRSYTFAGLAAGSTGVYQVTALNTTGQESARSNVGTKTIRAVVDSTYQDSESVTVTEPPAPGVPVLTVQ